MSRLVANVKTIEVMKVYKILHIPTGFFYTPNKGLGHLAVGGKIYTQKPKERSYYVMVVINSSKITSKKTRSIMKHFNIEDVWIDGRRHYYNEGHQTLSEEWEIIEMELK